MARALYIHWPFCVSKCPYCDFNSHVRERVSVYEWTEALLADLREEARFADGETLDTIFFGGGTPSLMSPVTVRQLLTQAERLWGFSEDIEITLESNPASYEAARFEEFAEAGVNRISIGAQSFRDDALQFLGRRHKAMNARLAIEHARKHFPRISFDLIYARPGQTAEEWREELTEALEFGTGHLSLYQLTIEQGTRFATDVRRGVFDPLEDDLAGELYLVTQEMTDAAGIPAYEISNYAVPGAECRHNLTYWRYEDYHGIGPGAHGRRGGVATMRHRKPENFLKAVRETGSGLSETRQLGRREQASEALLMGLRLAEGIDLQHIARRFGLSSGDLVAPEKVSLYRDLGFLQQSGERLCVTRAGMPLLDALLGEIVPASLAAS